MFSPESLLLFKNKTGTISLLATNGNFFAFSDNCLSRWPASVDEFHTSIIMQDKNNVSTP